jgi:hypothetical protein
VLGDLSDGPGFDYFEEFFLTQRRHRRPARLGFQPELLFTHAQHDVAADQRYTAVFEDFVPTVQVRHLLLDHMLLSPGLTGTKGLRRVKNSGAVRHAEYEAQVVQKGTRRENRPSDHRPVSVDLR